MAKLNNASSNKYESIEDVPYSHDSIGPVENLNDKSNKSIKILEPYSRIKEDKFIYFNRVKDRDINIISIFEASNQYIDFIHVVNTINQTAYCDYR